MKINKKGLNEIVLVIMSFVLLGTTACGHKKDDSDNDIKVTTDTNSSGIAEKPENTDINSSKKEESEAEVSFSAYDYYNESSEEIVSIENADSYEGTITASDAFTLAEEKGFDQSELTYAFDVNGKYLGETEAADGSDDKAPLYQTMYFTENNEVWTVYFIGDAVYACPISYLYSAKLDHEIIFSESDTLMSYDDSENKYYTTVPKESVVKLVVVDKINADTLEKYTAEELEKL